MATAGPTESEPEGDRNPHALHLLVFATACSTGQGQGPAFQVRPGAPQSADLALALELLSGKSTSRSSQQEPAAPQEHVEDEGVEATGGAAMASGDGGREGEGVSSIRTMLPVQEMQMTLL